MARSQEETPGQQPVMSAAMFHVLLALADGEKHGYAILKEVKRRTGGKVQLSAGTLYGIIKRLNGEDWIVESNDRPAAGVVEHPRHAFNQTRPGRRRRIGG